MPSDPVTRGRRALADILENIDLAEGFVRGLDEDLFHADLLRIYAVTRCLEIILEASRRLPSDLQARHENIPWKEIAEAGNIYRHD